MVTTTINILRDNKLCSHLSFTLNRMCTMSLSPLLEVSGVDFSFPVYYLAGGYCALLVMRLRSKFCFFNLSWFGIKRYWHLTTEVSFSFRLLLDFIQDSAGRSSKKKTENEDDNDVDEEHEDDEDEEADEEEEELAGER